MALLSVNNLSTHFRTDEGLVKAVDDISFELEEGKVLGLVGESGCGKTVTAYSLMNLFSRLSIVQTQGSVFFAGSDLLAMTEDELRRIRGKDLSMIFQDPMTSLNPYLTIETQLMEVLAAHRSLSKIEARKEVVEMLDRVGLPHPQERITAYPHQFSGGMRQRVMIAMALLCSPKLLIADEPTTALDVTVQAQVLGLLRGLKEEHGMSMILVTHDLGVVAGVADEIAVMYAGKIVEMNSTEALFEHPRHPYTQALLNCLPDPRRTRGDKLVTIEGHPPHGASWPNGCAFHPRCPQLVDRCRSESPMLVPCEPKGRVSCWEAKA